MCQGRVLALEGNPFLSAWLLIHGVDILVRHMSDEGPSLQVLKADGEPKKDEICYSAARPAVEGNAKAIRPVGMLNYMKKNTMPRRKVQKMMLANGKDR